MQRGVFICICLILAPCQGGCLYCAYPKLDFTAPTKIETPVKDVHVFRVETATEGILPLGGFIDVSPDRLRRWEWQPTSHRLAELDLDHATNVPAQYQMSFSYGFAIPILVANVLIHRSHAVSVRLYRPGYELVEMNHRAERVVWKQAADYRSQELAVDQLLTWPLDPGSASPAHREGLLFGAAEYERIATIAPTTSTLLLKEKAATLRKLAEK